MASADVQAAAIITKSYLLTEIAANQDPKIAEQNRLIAQQRKEFEEREARELSKSPHELVADSWHAVTMIPHFEKVAGEILFRRIFELEPEALPLFSFSKDYKPDSDELYDDSVFRVHSKAVLASVTAAVGLLEKHNLGALIHVLKDLGAKHSQFDFTKVHYDLVGGALLYTLEKALGDSFTPRVKQAWIGVYDVITKQMMIGAAEAKAYSHLTEEQKAEKKEAEVIMAASYFLTEEAANRDESIAEQNRAIAEQKKRYEETGETSEPEKSATELVVESWAIVAKIPNYEKVAGTILFGRIFQLNADALQLFSFAQDYKHDDDALYKDPLFMSHSISVVKTVSAAVGLLEAGDMDTLVSVLNDLGAKHAKFDFTKVHYDLVGESLLYTLNTALDNAFTPKVKQAWVTIYDVIAQEMMKGAEIAKAEKGNEKTGVLWV